MFFALIGGSPSAKYISTLSKHGEHLVQDANQLMAQLRRQGRDADLSSVGDAFLLEHRFEATPTTESGNGSARSSPPNWATSPSANGMALWNPVKVCIWCSSRNGPRDVCLP